MNALPGVNPFLSSPFPWVVLAALFAGAALSRASMRTGNRRDPDRARTRKWILTCVYLSIAVVIGLVAVFVPGPEKMNDVRLAWAAAVAAVLAFCALRFKKALGIPVVVLLVVAVLVLGLFLQSIRAFTGETQIASVRVISAESASMKLELLPRGGDAVLLTMEGQYFAPLVKVVIFNDFFVFLGAKTWYRFEGLTSFNQNLRQGNTDFRFPQPSGMSEKLWAFFEANETRIPGVKTVQIELVMKKVREFATYEIMIQNDGGVEIVARSG